MVTHLNLVKDDRFAILKATNHIANVVVALNLDIVVETEMMKLVHKSLWVQYIIEGNSDDLLCPLMIVLFFLFQKHSV